MKNTATAVLLFLILVTAGFLPGAIDRVAGYLQQGDAAQLSKLAAQKIELSILDDDNTLTPAQLQSKLQAFFTANKPVSVKIIHRIESNPNLIYAVATLHTANANFRVSYTIKSSGGNFELTELHIETEKDL